MADPTVKVEMAFGNSPIDPLPRWLDITQYVKGFDTKRGRNTELDTIDAGTATLTLDNSSGLFTPRRIHPNIVPDPSFENGLRSDDTISGAGTISFKDETTYPTMFGGRGGRFIAQLTATSTSPFYFLRPIKPTPGKWVCVSGWLADDGGTALTSGLFLQVTVNGTSSYPGSGYADRPFYAGTYITFVTQIPAAYDSIKIEVATSGTIASGNRVWFEGLSVQEFDTSADAYAEANRQYKIRPRCPLRLTANDGASHSIAYGFIERWPLQLSDSAPDMDVPVVDMSKVLGDIQLGNSDTGMLERARPDIYFAMQESEAGLLDTISGFKLLAFWDGYLAAPNPTDDNPLPVITYGADSILPSETGSAADLGGYWVEQN